MIVLLLKCFCAVPEVCLVSQKCCSEWIGQHLFSIRSFFFSTTCSPGPNLGVRLLLVVLGAVLCHSLVAGSLVQFFQVSRKMLNNLSLSSITCEVRASQLCVCSTRSSGPTAVECFPFRSFKSKTRKLHCILKHLSLKLDRRHTVLFSRWCGNDGGFSWLSCYLQVSVTHLSSSKVEDSAIFFLLA